MTEPTDRLKIREQKGMDDILKQHQNQVENFVWNKDEKLEYQHALMKSHLGFARFHLHHSTQVPPLSDEQIYDLWQEKSREK